MKVLKTCRQCSSTEPGAKFRKYRHTCQKCESVNATAWAKRNMSKKLANNKRYLSSELGKAAVYKSSIRFKEKFPEKRTAHLRVQTAIRNGTLKKKPCEFCSNDKAQAHHTDYSKPLEVNWLCARCHVKLHRFLMLAEREKNTPKV